MSEKIYWINFDQLEKFMQTVFIKVGVPEADAATCAHVLITADKRGIDSHGIARFKHIYIDRIKKGQINPVTKLEVVRESPTTAVIDGHNGMGQVIATRAMQLAIEKAGQYGMGMVAVRNSNHYGIAGYYALMAVGKDMIGITGTNARPSIAPTFGIENMLGTNPLTFGLPTDEEFPFVLDCATSVSQRGKIETYARLNKPIPAGWVIDRQGKTRTDSEEILLDLVRGQAALVPLGGIGEETSGYKGYGYATVVEILSAALQNGAFLKSLAGLDDKGKTVPYRLGHFFMAIKIDAFIEPREFKKITGDILRALRNSERMPGAERIYTAGEKEHLIWQERKNKGAMVDEELRKQLEAFITEYGLTDFHFSFDKD